MNESKQHAGSPPPADPTAFYDDMWRSYGHLDAVSPAAFHRRRLVVQLAAHYAGRAANILDVGCGQGELLRELSDAIPGARVYGADVSEQSLIDSRKRNPTFELFEMNLTRPDFASYYPSRVGAFDLVICSEVLEHIPDDALAASRLCELLAPGGVAVVTVPGGKMSEFDKVIGHQRHYTPGRLDVMLSEAGLRPEKVLAWGFPFHSFYRTAVRVASRMSVARGGGAPSTAKEESNGGGISNVLGAAYTLFGKALKPLFYLNAQVWGEQLIAVAKRP